MLIVCPKSNLLNGLQIVSKAVPNKTTMDIMECILLDASLDDITLTASDTQLGMKTTIDGEIVKRGIVAIDAKIFLEMVRKLPDSDVTIETEEGTYKTTVTCGKAKFNIMGKSPDTFTPIPDVEGEVSVEISNFALKEVIRQTVFSIADNDNNKMMTGELFDIKDNQMRFISLDGHRVSIRKIEINGNYAPVKLIVPGKTLNELSKILSGEADSMVTIIYTDRHILFEFDKTIVVSRLIEGEYFMIDQMLSGDYETKVKVNKKEFLSCLDRATLLVKEGDKKPVIISMTDNNMELRIKSVLGSMNEDIEIEKNGKDLQIGFNPKFLIDALRVIDDEDVELYMVNSKAPCFIKNVEESYIYLVLPVNFMTID